MVDNNEEVVVRYDLDEYIENIINGLSDEELQEIIDSTHNGCLSGIVTPKLIKKHLRNSIREIMLNKQKEG